MVALVEPLRRRGPRAAGEPRHRLHRVEELVRVVSRAVGEVKAAALQLVVDGGPASVGLDRPPAGAHADEGAVAAARDVVLLARPPLSVRLGRVGRNDR